MGRTKFTNKIWRSIIYGELWHRITHLISLTRFYRLKKEGICHVCYFSNQSQSDCVSQITNFGNRQKKNTSGFYARVFHPRIFLYRTTPTGTYLFPGSYSTSILRYVAKQSQSGVDFAGGTTRLTTSLFAPTRIESSVLYWDCYWSPACCLSQYKPSIVPNHTLKSASLHCKSQFGKRNKSTAIATSERASWLYRSRVVYHSVSNNR